MDEDRSKRTPEEVLFKWEDGGEAKRRFPADLSGAFSTLSGLASETLSARAASAFHNVAPSSVVPPDNLDTSNVHLEAKKLRETIANIQLSHNRDWLASNTHVAALGKLDVLDRVSCLLLHPESAMRFEARRYAQRDSTSEFEFTRALYENRLRQLNTGLVPELCEQPVYVRNSTLVSKMKGKCSCPLDVYSQWDPRTSGPATLQHRGTLLRHSPATGSPDLPSTGAPTTTIGNPNAGFQTARETSATPYVGEFSRGDQDGMTTLDNHGNSPSQGGLTSRETRSAPATGECGDWNLSRNDFQPRSQVGVNVTSLAASSATPNAGPYALEHLDTVCPMHAATPLPEMLRTRGGRMGVIRDLGLVYRYHESTINGERVYTISLHKLGSGSKVFHFRLPSRLQTFGAVHLRDFELERYSSAIDLNDSKGEEADKLCSSYLASLYSGPALMIATVSEFVIAVVNEQAGVLRLGVLFRERNKGHIICQIMCHRASGRVFLLATNSRLYEYQYQLGAVEVKEHSVFGFLMSAVAKSCKFLLSSLSNDRVYKLYGTVPSGYAVEVTAGASDESSPTHSSSHWWHGAGNCLEEFGKTCPAPGVAYWPPLEWRELHLSLQESSFADGAGRDACTCSRRTACVRREARTCLKLLNPWDMSYFGLFSIGSARVCVDEDRWLVCMLGKETGDLSVYRIPDECSFDKFVKGVFDFDRVFPYTLTFFSLRNADIVAQLRKSGYFRFVGESPAFRCSGVLPAPAGGPEGVDIVLLDRFGSRIYVGFVCHPQKQPSLAVKGFRLAQPLLEPRSTARRAPTFHLGRSASGNAGQTDFGAFPVRQNYHYARDLFVSCESYVKSGDLTLAKVALFTPEPASLCQRSASAPQSVSEELWSHNQRPQPTPTAGLPATSRPRPMEWFDELCFLLAPGEEILSVHVEPQAPAAESSLLQGAGWDLVVVTSQKIYTFHRSNLLRVLAALLQHPVSTLRYLDPPPITQGHSAALSPRGRPKSSPAPEGLHFVDIFDDSQQRGEMYGADASKEALAYGLYYLAWLYTPEEVFRACWQFLLERSDPLLDSVLLGGGDDRGLLLTSLGISSQLFGWTAPGAYALDDAGKPTTPVLSPWCKFVIFGEPKLHRFNRVCTGLTSPAIDGALALACAMLESLWLERTFTCVPLFTSTARAPTPQGSVPFGPDDQVHRRNEFVVGPKFESDLILSLSRPVDEVRSTLSQLRRLYLLLCRVALNYESLQPQSIEAAAESLSRLPPSLQRDVFSHDSCFDGSSDTATDAQRGIQGSSVARSQSPADTTGTHPSIDVTNVLNRLRERRDNDAKTLRELVTLLEISQEYLACCLLLHRNCVLGDVQHDFGRMFANVELLPSHSSGRLSPADLLYHRLMQPHEPVAFPFRVEYAAAGAKPPYAFTMSREFFYIISRSNMLNLCSNQEFFRSFRVAVWLAGGEVSNLQDYFYGHLFKCDELRVKHWSSMVKSLERQLATADSDTSLRARISPFVPSRGAACSGLHLRLLLLAGDGAVRLLPEVERDVLVLDHVLHLLAHGRQEQHHEVEQEQRPEDREVQELELGARQDDVRGPDGAEPEGELVQLAHEGLELVVVPFVAALVESSVGLQALARGEDRASVGLRLRCADVLEIQRREEARAQVEQVDGVHVRDDVVHRVYDHVDPEESAEEPE
ncbi:enoyl-CoA hydratase [Babesia caballi]|uniref:Enoyl-CoA hydratase n=1 Tax=Babesia caballi TaxID=5871 RepID=A0AAV4LPV4_BABCB|nr:enoyl-CoA hydratase [Babesia caballi]